MEFDISYSIESEQQFWDELDDIVAAECDTHAQIDNALRSYLRFIGDYKAEYLQDDHAIAQCSMRLLQSNLFRSHGDYVRRQIVFCFLQEDSPDTLHVLCAFLSCDGSRSDVTFEMMSEEGAFPRLIDVIQDRKDDGAGLHRSLVLLMYEMSRVQRIRIEDLMLLEDDFINYMFEVIEDLSDDTNDPFHSACIRVLLVLNEQYMVCVHDPSAQQALRLTETLTNKVVKTLATRGSVYKSFGQSMILMLNRESETSLQLLILKLLYLLFTSPPTYEYFYTNDLHVLLDIIIRNLQDLSNSSSALRHTYLRVLYPFLAHSQLQRPPHYKREDIQRLLSAMAGTTTDHFGALDETTLRLVERCRRVDWLKDSRPSQSERLEPVKLRERLASVGGLSSAMDSSLSVVEMAVQTSKPGVQTPSRDKKPVNIRNMTKPESSR